MSKTSNFFTTYVYCILTAHRQNSEKSRTKILDDDIDHASAEDFKDARRKVTLDPSLVDDLLNFR